MNVQQEVPPTVRRPRRRVLHTLLLISAPVALAAAGGLVAANLAPAPELARTTQAAAIDANVREVSHIETSPVGSGADVQAAVVAPALETDAQAAVPQIEVSLPPEPEPEPELNRPERGNNSSGNNASTGTSNSSSGSSSQSAGTQSSNNSNSGSGSSSSSQQSSGSNDSAPAPAPKQSFESYCASPSSPHSAGSVQGLLSAANKERARIGVAPLSWSGSLASAATNWSKAMAAKDTDGNGSAMAHNPNRPGAENVGASGSSGGMSVGAASSKIHSGWMYSNGHCRNVMNPAYTTMGAGSATTADGKVVYITANYR